MENWSVGKSLLLPRANSPFCILHSSFRSAFDGAEEDVFQRAASRRGTVDRDAGAGDGVDEGRDVVEAVHADAHLVVRPMLARLDHAELLDAPQEGVVVRAEGEFDVERFAQEFLERAVTDD